MMGMCMTPKTNVHPRIQMIPLFDKEYIEQIQKFNTDHVEKVTSITITIMA